MTFDVDGYTVTGGTLNYNNVDPDPVEDPITDTDRGIMVRTGTATIASDVVSTNGLSKSGDGTLVLSGSNKINGTLNIEGGHLVATAPGALNGVTNLFMQDDLQLADDSRIVTEVSVDLGGATLSVVELMINTPGSNSLSNGTVSVSGTALLGQGTINAVLDGAGALRKTLSYTATLNGRNTLTGPVNVQTGALVIGATGGLTNAETITINSGATFSVDGDGNAVSDTATINNSGTFELTGSDETVGAIFGAGNVALNENTLTINQDSQIKGVVSGSGDIVFQGTGFLALRNNNTMTGTLYNTGGGSIDNRGEFVGDIHNENGSLSNGSWINGTIENSGSFTNNNAVNGELINKAGGTVTNGAWIFGHVTNELGATFNEQGNSGSYGQGVTNNGTFNINGAAFGLTGGTFENNNILNNNSGNAITFFVGTGGNLVNNGTINGGTSGITLSGDAFTIGAGSTLTNVTIDVDNLTTDMDYDIQGTTDYNFTNNATATVVANANFSGGDLTNTDTLNVSGGNLEGVGQLTNAGTINLGVDGVGPRILSAESLTNTGTIDFQNGSILTVTQADTNNDGYITAVGGTISQTAGDFNNLENGEVRFTGNVGRSLLVENGVLRNAGMLAVEGGTLVVESGGGRVGEKRHNRFRHCCDFRRDW
ncbi:beta strand repeat-containing protein [Loktanella agnita]|uniref:beta strand repeat-containing protein n=1 Tax=Loktanella agnita TaxID=287097 RepID=UPI003986AEAA